MVYIERELKEEFEKTKDLSNIIAIVGARQAGKTTFIKEESKGIDASYVTFDDPDARELFDQDIKKFEIQYLTRQVTVIDEVQYGKEAGLKLKYLADKGRKVWITSSSETILGKEVLSYLVGRVSILRAYPFSLLEFLIAKGQKQLTDSILKRGVWEHMTYGGYPKVVLTEDTEGKRIILKDLYETMVLKDIAMVFSINDARSLEEFARYLAANAGSAVGYEKMSNALDLSFQTVKKYFDAMEKSYMIKRIPPLYANKSKEISKQPKVYFMDTGLRNAISNEFPSEPTGNLFENYVLTELMKMGFSPKYWRTKAGAEVDFVVEKNNKLVPIEVKLSSGNRIERGFRSFIETYKPKRAVVVSYSGEKGETEIGDCTVVFTDVIGLREILR